MPTTTEQLEFHHDDRSSMVAAMGPLAALPGTGWINFDAGIDEDVQVPARSLLAQLLGSRGPDVPHCSWVPEAGAATSIGVQHATGPRAVKRLADAGITVPPGWRLLQDHPKRGLVVAVPAGAEPAVLDEVLRWLLDAGAALTTVPLSGYWMASVHRRS